MSASRGMSLYLNLGHALDHLLMLVFPTVVLAMGEELGGGNDMVKAANIKAD